MTGRTLSFYISQRAFGELCDESNRRTLSEGRKVSKGKILREGLLLYFKNKNAPPVHLYKDAISFAAEGRKRR